MMLKNKKEMAHKSKIIKKYEEQEKKKKNKKRKVLSQPLYR